jgi:hypothetical protein
LNFYHKNIPVNLYFFYPQVSRPTKDNGHESVIDSLPEMKMTVRHSGLDPESRTNGRNASCRLSGVCFHTFWIPAFAGMTDDLHFHNQGRYFFGIQ